MFRPSRSHPQAIWNIMKYTVHVQKGDLSSYWFLLTSLVFTYN